MWASWASDVRRFALAAAAAAALACALAATASAARVIVNGVTVSGAGGRHHSRVSVSPGGVEITTDSDSVLVNDSLGHGAIVVDDDTNGLVRFLSDAHVKAGDKLDGDVVAIFGNVRVDGTVNGSAVAVFGRVDVAPGGTVGGDAVAVCGSVHVAAGTPAHAASDSAAGSVNGDAVAVLGSVDVHPRGSVGGEAVAVGGHVEDTDGGHIGGKSVSVGLLPLTLGLPALPTVVATILVGWLFTVFFGWLFALMFPDRLARVGVTASRRTFLSIVLSIAAFLAWPAVSLLVMATIIGLPVGLILFFAYPVEIYAGQLAATYVLGCKLMRRRLGEGGAVGPIAAGSFLIALFYLAAAICFSLGGAGGALALFFGLVGLLVSTGLTIIGSGAFLLSRGGALPLDVRPAAPAAPPVAPAPEPVA